MPKIGASGERYRDKQIAIQLPKQDLAMAYCKHVDTQHRSSYEDFVSARNEIALDIGYIKDAPHSTKCVGCNEQLAQGDMTVIAPKFPDNMLWHPKCFCCSVCEELLVDLTYCVHEDKLFCERHYAEMLKPRCGSCDEVSVCYLYSFYFLVLKIYKIIENHTLLSTVLFYFNFLTVDELVNEYFCHKI